MASKVYSTYPGDFASIIEGEDLSTGATNWEPFGPNSDYDGAIGGYYPNILDLVPGGNYVGNVSGRPDNPARTGAVYLSDDMSIPATATINSVTIHTYLSLNNAGSYTYISGTGGFVSVGLTGTGLLTSTFTTQGGGSAWTRASLFTTRFGLLIYSFPGSTGETDCSAFYVTVNYTAENPEAETSSASSISATTATLNGFLFTNGGTYPYQFEWGLTTSYGNTTTLTNGTSGSDTDLAVNASISGLVATTTYHFRLVAYNGATPIYGSDMSFTTTSSDFAALVF